MNDTPTGLPDWLNYLIAVILLPAAAAFWRFVGGPFWQWFTKRDEAEEAHERTVQDKMLEFQQDISKQRDDYLSEMLDGLIEHLKKEVLIELKAIGDKVYRGEMTLNQFRLIQEGNSRILYDFERRLRGIEAKVTIMIELISGEKREDDESI